jgi:hypothetical protein
MSKEITLADLGQRSRQIAEYYFAHPEMTRVQIAAALGIHITRISQVLNHPKVRACYPWLARQQKSDLIPKAMKAIDACITQDANLIVKLKASEGILKSERVLDTPAIRIDGEIRITSVREIQQKLQEALNLAGEDVIDGEIVDDTTQDTPPSTPPLLNQGDK